MCDPLAFANASVRQEIAHTEVILHLVGVRHKHRVAITNGYFSLLTSTNSAWPLPMRCPRAYVAQLHE